MSTKKNKKKINAETNMFPEYPKLTAFLNEHNKSFTGISSKGLMIYGIHDDDITRNRSSEIDTNGNCLLESLFYLLDPHKCDDLEKAECKQIKNEFSDKTRKEIVKTVKDIDPTIVTIDTHSFSNIEKSTTYLGPESLKILALMYKCNFIVYELLPTDVSFKFYCNTNGLPSKLNTYILLLKGGVGQHFIPLRRKRNPNSYVIKALMNTPFNLYEEDNGITPEFVLNEHMVRFSKPTKDMDRILDLTCGIDVLKPYLLKAKTNALEEEASLFGKVKEAPKESPRNVTNKKQSKANKASVNNTRKLPQLKPVISGLNNLNSPRNVTVKKMSQAQLNKLFESPRSSPRILPKIKQIKVNGVILPVGELANTNKLVIENGYKVHTGITRKEYLKLKK
jgi:hypothetical protein